MRRGVDLPRLPPLAQDALLAVLVTAMQVQGVGATAAAEAAADGQGTARALSDLAGLAYLLVVVSGLVLAGRRRWPVGVFLVTAAASLVYYALDFPDGPVWVGLFVALYTLTSLGDGRRSLVIAGAGIAVLSIAWLAAAADIEPREALGWVFFRIGASVMSAALGESARSRRFIAAEAQDRADRAERTREEDARARVDAERLRIAREVHDTVAHAIAIINVQAGVTAHVLHKRPDQVGETLVAIEQTSARALREMRTIVGMLRDASDDRVPHPGLGLGQLDELVAKARGAGLDIELEGMPGTVALPSAVDSVAYRLLQESVTNVIRHVGPTRMTVALECGPDVLRVRVTDEGRRGTQPEDRRSTRAGPPEEGRGILGMRERCELLGGDFRAGPTADGGFEVTARLPLAPTGEGPA